MLCVTASNNILENANREEDMPVCVNASKDLIILLYDLCCQPHCEEDMLCVTASLIMKKIYCVCTTSLMKKMCCVLLPASLQRRYAVCYCQPHEKDMLCVIASLIAKKICCVLLPASLRRRYTVCVQPAS